MPARPDPNLPALLRVRLGRGRAAANEIAPNLHGWWCANLGRPLRLLRTD